MKNAATALQLFPLGAPATGLQPACRKVAATDGVQLRAQNRPETRMNPRVAMQPRSCNRPTVLQRLRCTLHPRGEATPATVATDTPHQRGNAATGHRLPQAARCTASTMNAGFTEAPPMKPPADAPGTHGKAPTSDFRASTWVGSQTTPGACKQIPGRSRP